MWGLRMTTKAKDLKPEHLCGIYSEIATILGVEAAMTLHNRFRGTQVSFPVEILSKEYIFTQIKQEYNGRNIKELATKYGYTEKWVRKIIKEEKIL